MSSEAATGGGSKYDRQLIVALLGTPEDAETLEQAAALNGKRRDAALPSEVVQVRRSPGGDAQGLDALRQSIAGQLGVPQPVTGRSRVYLLADRCDPDGTVAGWSAHAVAGLLADAGLREVKMISIVADGAGRDWSRDENAQTEAGARSFASELHRVLREGHGVRTSVHARVGAVRVLPETLVVGGVSIGAGRKVTAPMSGDPADTHHATHTKLKLSWDGDVQRCEWAY